MKTLRELILERHRNAEAMLMAIRGEDLAAAVGVSRSLRSRMEEGLFRIALQFWQEAVLPWRRAWVGMALVWLVLLAINLSSNGWSAFWIRTEPPMTAENWAAWRQQRRFMPQFSRTTDADLVAPKPRSGSRSEIPQKIVSV